MMSVPATTVISAGEFGTSVLAGLAPDDNVTPVPNAAAIAFGLSGLTDATHYVVVTDHEEPRLFKHLDRFARQAARPWIPIVLELTSLRVGPYVDPHSDGPCYTCYATRRRQHGALTDSDRALWHEYDTNPGFGYRGFTHATTTLACATIHELTSGTGPFEPGEVRYYGLLDASMRREVVTAVHGCTGCGSRFQRSDAVTTLVNDLRGDRS